MLLISWLTIAIGIVVVHLTEPLGELKLPTKIATELLLATGGLLFSVLAVAYSYWQRCQPMEVVEFWRHRGRPICHCTEAGMVMLSLPRLQPDTPDKSNAQNFTFIGQVYQCPLCKQTEAINRPVKTI